MTKDRRRTTRTEVDGWQLYVIDDPGMGRTMVVIREHQWQRGADNTPAVTISNAVGSVALMKAQQWCAAHPHPSAAGGR